MQLFQSIRYGKSQRFVTLVLVLMSALICCSVWIWPLTDRWNGENISWTPCSHWPATWKGQMRTRKGGAGTTAISHVTPSPLSLLGFVWGPGVTSDLLYKNLPRKESRERDGAAWDLLLLKKDSIVVKWGNISWEFLGKRLVPRVCAECWVISCLQLERGENGAFPCRANPVWM